MRRLGPIEGRHAQAAACELMRRRPPGAARTALIEVACHNAAATAPRVPHRSFYLADSYISDGKFEQALAPLMRARELLEGGADADQWQLLAMLLERVQLPTLSGSGRRSTPLRRRGGGARMGARDAAPRRARRRRATLA